MRALSLVAAALLLAACDSGGPDAPGSGRFEAEISGGLSRSLEGTAGLLSVFDGPGEEPILSVTMLDQSVLIRSISLSDEEGVLDGEGTYGLGGGGPLQLLYQDGLGADGGSYVSASGTLRVTRYGDDRIAGTFTAELAPAFGRDEGAAASLSGTFDAVRIPAPF
ncbi:hypothetical protein RQM47_00445 [Rubrivirga sp. S365]|uniref:Lipoprotein n=1 Tax=Rubrivirga litoralis TaxID=3075598 RepID=A0ABU3BUJ7_9BACT|nr:MULTISPECIES: hypothetical protein [unclassified Rubrivirga]MDT0632826.1 hypothetical protein [Rubrivirga sp. F394]MDT7855104.1 hypothetical protein [Rubrivirga sp. S365]